MFLFSKRFLRGNHREYKKGKGEVGTKLIQEKDREFETLCDVSVRIMIITSRQPKFS